MPWYEVTELCQIEGRMYGPKFDYPIHYFSEAPVQENEGRRNRLRLLTNAEASSLGLTPFGDEEAAPAAEPESSKAEETVVDDEVTQRKNAIVEALQKLDHSNKDHWTGTGRPKAKVVSALLAEVGEDPVESSEIETVAEGFRRQE